MVATTSDVQPDRRDSHTMDLPVFSSGEIITELLNDVSDLAVVYVTVDDFSKLCATSRPIDGDRILILLEREFQPYVPEHVDGYTLPRTGYIYLMKNTTSRQEIEQFTQQLVNRSKNPLDVDGESINISLNVGIARTSDKSTNQSLVDQAQFAQQNASAETGSTVSFFDSDEAQTIREEVTLKNDLYEALKNDEFFLKYQPVVSLEDNRVEGAEALIRWEHPERGIISPGKFIPLAEKTGQIIFMDRWVIKHAMSQAARWHESYDQDLPIGINISAWQFRDNFLVEKVDELLEETDLPPELIKIEVTETSMMKDVDRTAKVLQGLDYLGVQIALDDFGTGHATFEYLSQFPIDEMKIDRSFLNFDDVYEKNQKLVDMMIQTGKRVGTNILAEGIETEVQLNFLKNRGCETAQGFLFAKPLEVEEFEAKVESGKSLYQS